MADDILSLLSQVDPNLIKTGAAGQLLGSLATPHPGAALGNALGSQAQEFGKLGAQAANIQGENMLRQAQAGPLLEKAAQARALREELQNNPSGGLAQSVRSAMSRGGYQVPQGQDFNAYAAMPLLEGPQTGPLAYAKALAAARGETAVNPLTGEYYQRRKAVGPLAGEGGGGGGGGIGGGASPISAIADAIENGTAPPDMKGMYRFAGPVRAELAKRGFDLVTAGNEFAAMQKHIQTMNGPQQTRLAQSMDFTQHAINNIEQLYDQWTKLGGASGFRTFNKAALAASQQVPGQMGATATALQAAINDLQEGMANIYMGGNTPTDKAIDLAKKNLEADYNPQTFTQMLKLLRTNLGYRQNAMVNSPPAGLGGAPNRYAAPTQQAAEQAPSAAPTAIPHIKSNADYEALPKGATYIDPNGKQRTKQ